MVMVQAKHLVAFFDTNEHRMAAALNVAAN